MYVPEKNKKVIVATIFEKKCVDYVGFFQKIENNFFFKQNKKKYFIPIKIKL